MKKAWQYIVGGFAFLIAALALLLRQNRTLKNKAAAAVDEKDLAVATERKERATLNFKESYEKYRKARAKLNSSNKPK